MDTNLAIVLPTGAQLRRWRKPVLTSASIKAITAGQPGSGAETSGMVMSASDMRLKHVVGHVGMSERGIPIYDFVYLWGGPVHRGVMAQDVLGIAPGAVFIAPTGYLHVDYAQIDVTVS